MVIGGGITRVKDLAAVAPELGQYRRLKNFWFPVSDDCRPARTCLARVADRREESGLQIW